jgi:ABC-type phosphate/phosphonate transport system substrate-binding protein
VEDRTLLLGAVASSPAVVTIWDGFKTWLNKNGLPFDFILYSNYSRQVDDLVTGRIDVAWNTPLAWIRAQRRAEAMGKTLEPIAMRDVDFDLTSVIVVRADSGIERLADLKDRVVAVGSPDSAEATVMPLGCLCDAGLVPASDFRVHYCDDVIGYEGGRQEAEVKAARGVVAGDVDAAGLATGNYEAFLANGTIPAGVTKILGYTSPYDHCNLTAAVDVVDADLVQRLRDLLLKMSYDDPELQPYMELEYVKQWMPARASHYALVERAMDQVQKV